MITDLEIVFFHELGHYIAHEITFRNFGIHKVESILLTEHNINQSKVYGGETIITKPYVGAENVLVINLPEKIAELIYGCYFQSLYLNVELSNCFDHSNSNCKGFKDKNDVIGALSQFSIDAGTRKILYPFMEVEYFNYLKSIKTDFDTVFNLKPIDFLICSEIGYFFNLDLLSSSLQDFYVIHENVYLNFLQRIKIILNWKN